MIGADGMHSTVRRLASVYGVHQTGQARAAFLFRRSEELRFDHRDKDTQRQLLVDEYRDYGWQVPRLLSHLDAAEDFYFDSSTQITLDSWQRGRIALAGELAAARSHLPSGLRNYETKIRRYVDLTRAAAPKTMASVIPRTPTAVQLTASAVTLLTHLPAWIQRRVWSQNGSGKALGALPLPDYSDLVRAR